MAFELRNLLLLGGDKIIGITLLIYNATRCLWHSRKIQSARGSTRQANETANETTKEATEDSARYKGKLKATTNFANADKRNSTHTHTPPQAVPKHSPQSVDQAKALYRYM